MEPGNVVLYRSIYRAHVRWAFPHRYVCKWDGRFGIYCQPGNQGKLLKRAVNGSYLKVWVTNAPSFDGVWEGAHVLRFMRPGDAHTVELYWDLNWNFTGWYVNLQSAAQVERLVLRHDRLGARHRRRTRRKLALEGRRGLCRGDFARCLR